MSHFRQVRVCGVCTEHNAVDAHRCVICGAAVDTTFPPRVVLVRRRRLLGVPERVILGCGAGVLLGMMLQPHDPVILWMASFAASADDGLDRLMAPLAQPSFILVLMCGVIVGGSTLAWLSRASLLHALGIATDRLRPCPRCSVMVASNEAACGRCGAPLSLPQAVAG